MAFWPRHVDLALPDIGIIITDMRALPYVLILATLLLSGCGHLYFFDETHTHIEKRRVMQTDDETVATIAAMIKRMQAKSAPKESPFDGFDWDEELLTEDEGKKRNE